MTTATMFETDIVTAVDARAPRLGGMAIGLAVAADILMGGPLTGAAMNPARWFGPAFVDAAERFLAEHGHLGQNHDDLRLASWAEAPRLFLGRIAPRLRAPAAIARPCMTACASGRPSRRRA